MGDKATEHDGTGIADPGSDGESTVAGTGKMPACAEQPEVRALGLGLAGDERTAVPAKVFSGAHLCSSPFPNSPDTAT